MGIWKLRHRLFGTDFVFVRYGHDDHLKAVRVAPNGRKYIRICDRTIFLDEPGDILVRKITPLTFGGRPAIETD